MSHASLVDCVIHCWQYIYLCVDAHDTFGQPQSAIKVKYIGPLLVVHLSKSSLFNKLNDWSSSVYTYRASTLALLYATAVPTQGSLQYYIHCNYWARLLLVGITRRLNLLWQHYTAHPNRWWSKTNTCAPILRRWVAFRNVNKNNVYNNKQYRNFF